MTRSFLQPQVRSKADESSKTSETPVNDSEQNSSLEERSDLQADEKKREGPNNQREIGGRDGPDPTRYGDWEVNGRCIDF